MSNRRELPSEEEVRRMAAEMKVADPDATPGAFEEMTRLNMLALLKHLSVRNIDTAISDEALRRKVRLALWDSQRIDYLFHGKTFESSTGKLAIDRLPSWPGWKEKTNTGMRNKGIGDRVQLDQVKDAALLEKMVLRHFQMSAFTQMENMTGSHINPPPGIAGAWNGIKQAQATLGRDITEEGGKNMPFEVFFEPKGNMLVMEILDVKQAEWPEPSAKEWKMIRSCQQTKFGWEENGPLFPMMKTPKFPVILVRYAYCEGRPEGGLQFMTYLQNKIQKQPGMTDRKAAEKLHFHLTSGVSMSALHLRLWAQILDVNAQLVDKEYVEEQQSHWSGLSREQIKETGISFVVPCLRLRWRTLEELETGVKPAKVVTCVKCGKDGCKLSCGKCKGAMYCSSDCNKADWPTHKATCNFSKTLGNAGLPADKWYIPVRSVHGSILDTGFAVEQEAIKQSGCPMDGECPPNEYGDERFIIKLQAPPDYNTGGGQPQFKGTTVFVVDRRRSLFARTGPGDAAFALQQTGVEIPFHAAGYTKFRSVLRTRGIQGQLIYLWARRVGDCLETDLSDVPNQNNITWN
ncbi:hypothetical protein EXIGLDRAFT_844820 [Exidia glandulosa HHB12029]|uniref:MYND-type domain-containing protein n=1 Tax=Exidia glandulosa HHB12029 TaxID=1314781 RepID=A0A165BSJ6_EXIGL|nr:hypothetical protein EXIGLDRAFT_844820 [Exidia glandulosa HHB12029]